MLCLGEIMVSHFSEIELLKLRVAWFAWKDINSNEFLNLFIKIWEETLTEVELILKKCKFRRNLREVTKLGLTLQPNIGFCYSPIVNAYFFNVWTFLFCSDAIEKSLFFRPAFMLANELIHEHAHFRYLRDHQMLNRPKSEMKRFQKSHGFEGEKFALSEEAKFLKRIRLVIPRFEDVKLFRVKSWDSNGIPNHCEIRSTQIMSKRQTKESFKSVQMKKKDLQNLSTLIRYNGEMNMRKTENKSMISSILNLESKKEFPIIEMEIN